MRVYTASNNVTIYTHRETRLREAEMNVILNSFCSVFDLSPRDVYNDSRWSPAEMRAWEEVLTFLSPEGFSECGSAHISMNVNDGRGLILIPVPSARGAVFKPSHLYR